MKGEKRAKKTDFEGQLKTLEEIVEELEKGNLSLKDSLSLYKEGMKNLKSCFKYLQEAEKTIEILTRDEEGKVQAKPMELDEEE